VSELRWAFKEWAAICSALAAGRQAVILRKGGIEENGGSFGIEQTRFWLYPTYNHQRAEALKPDALPLLAQAEADRPASGNVRLTHWAEVQGAFQLHNLVAALKLGEFHIWSTATIQARFAYRTPGLFALPVRVWRAPAAIEVAASAEFAGCKSWVDLGRAWPTADSTPVLDDAKFRDLMLRLEHVLQPTALA
jgi:hypothetical protein